ncbi:hypothetical protein LX32DRAFT_222976 [Colletotrichum zoysiae]|uniref:Uncharacterized protein n=1 Tax=Colletotrichum zoysiae TaxID=1216348 RepID=A0AAD9H5L3_9PEZI|nr:hypothetical protein LX32DRAFT_222976 [Colletotrichum zoysiae]
MEGSRGAPVQTGRRQERNVGESATTASARSPPSFVRSLFETAAVFFGFLVLPLSSTPHVERKPRSDLVPPWPPPPPSTRYLRATMYVHTALLMDSPLERLETPIEPLVPSRSLQSMPHLVRIQGKRPDSGRRTGRQDKKSFVSQSWLAGR